MTKRTACFAAILAGSVAFSSIALAAENARMTMSQMIHMLQTMHASNLHVAGKSSLANTDHSQSMDTPPLDTTPSEQRSIQSAIRNNAALYAMLKARNVDLSSIAAASVGPNNSVTVYLK